MVYYDIEGKVALVSGGAEGIGFFCAKELLENGVKGVSILDWNEEKGKCALDNLTGEFGQEKIIFIKTDVSNKCQFEDAFRITVKTFNNLDIVVNNAGIFDDIDWEKQVAINMNGTIAGTLLAVQEYLPKHKSCEEGVVVNISSIAGLAGCAQAPIYAATKHGIIGLSLSFGSDALYQHRKVRVLAVCPGRTSTALVSSENQFLGPVYYEIHKKVSYTEKGQLPEHVGKHLIEVLKEGENGSVWISNEEKVFKVATPDLNEMLKN